MYLFIAVSVIAQLLAVRCSPTSMLDEFSYFPVPKALQRPYGRAPYFAGEFTVARDVRQSLPRLDASETSELHKIVQDKARYLVDDMGDHVTIHKVTLIDNFTIPVLTVPGLPSTLRIYSAFNYYNDTRLNDASGYNLCRMVEISPEPPYVTLYNLRFDIPSHRRCMVPHKMNATHYYIFSNAPENIRPTNQIHQGIGFVIIFDTKSPEKAVVWPYVGLSHDGGYSAKRRSFFVVVNYARSFTHAHGARNLQSHLYYTVLHEISEFNGTVLWSYDLRRFSTNIQTACHWPKFADLHHGNTITVDDADDSVYVSFRCMHTIIKWSLTTRQIVYSVGDNSGIQCHHLTGPLGYKRDKCYMRYQHGITLFDRDYFSTFSNGGKNPEIDRSIVMQVQVDPARRDANLTSWTLHRSFHRDICGGTLAAPVFKGTVTSWGIHNKSPLINMGILTLATDARVLFAAILPLVRFHYAASAALTKPFIGVYSNMSAVPDWLSVPSHAFHSDGTVVVVVPHTEYTRTFTLSLRFSNHSITKTAEPFPYYWMPYYTTLPVPALHVVRVDVVTDDGVHSTQHR